jgi:beta-glucosidase-like glycosyl hydrolase
VNFAPVCDVSTDPGDFIHARSMGLDAKGTASCAAAVVAQMSQDGMGSVLKHFPGYGNNADTHTGVAVDARPLQTFETSDFLPFRSALSADEGAGGRTAAVLVCHNIVQCMDKTLPASLSPAVHQILRQQLGFGGVVMTDDLAMDAVKAYAQNGDAAALALLAGNDLLVTTDYRAQIPQVLSAVESGALPESVIDEACTRVLTWKMDSGPAVRALRCAAGPPGGGKEALMRRSVRIWLLLLAACSVLTLPVLADSGPKPQLTVRVKHAPAEPYALDLLEQDQPGQYSLRQHGGRPGRGPRSDAAPFWPPCRRAGTPACSRAPAARCGAP